ncbi:protein kinase [Adlercreutzia mucosicola]|uniref:protein kinase domain-containing protein n=2 Tax=Adlercreutzia mucosicola TaxID=580026 RepID=UPI00214B88FA|nr:protein kinase [Adlercreutzia mucosicola]MCR2034965.1 protein kinase [Adlercreutzia mucosicola]
MGERILGGRYLLKERIGVGGMAAVWAAEDTVLGRRVAVKLMLPQYAGDSAFAQRFRQEATAAASLQSPRIVSIHDWGQQDDECYLVMEMLSGHDLRTTIARQGVLAPQMVRELGAQVCQALSVAHQHGIIHRDITPQNIMVLPDGNIKVMDFGIAKVAGATMTQTSTIIGTAHYLAPEQARGKEPTAATDLYSLGAVLYEAATGQPPFQGPDPISIIFQHVSAEPVTPKTVNPNIDDALESAILKALAKHPKDRFESAEAMGRALGATTSHPSAATMPLNAIAGTTQVLSPAPNTASEATRILNPHQAYASEHTQAMPSPHHSPTPVEATSVVAPAPRKNRRGFIIGAATIALALIAAGTFALTSHNSVDLPSTGSTDTRIADNKDATSPASNTHEEPSRSDDKATPQENNAAESDPTAESDSASSPIASSEPERDTPQINSTPAAAPNKTGSAPQLPSLLGLTQDEAVDKLQHGAQVSSSREVNEEGNPIKTEARVTLTAEPSDGSTNTPTVYLGLNAEGKIVQAGYSASTSSLGYGSLSFADAVSNEDIIQKTLAEAGVPVPGDAVSLPEDPASYTTFDSDGKTRTKEYCSFSGTVDLEGVAHTWSAVLSYDYSMANASGNLADTVRTIFIYVNA